MSIRDVLCNRSEGVFVCGDVLQVLPTLPDASIDLVFGSPPYEDLRSYGIDFSLVGEKWVVWMVKVVQASLVVCKGVAAFVVEGKTEHFQWSATPVLLMADLHRAGVCLRKPPAFVRQGIPGSGGPDWWRNDYELVICATNGKRLSWSDNTATGTREKRLSSEYVSILTDSVFRKPLGKMTANPRRRSGNREKQIYHVPELCNSGNVIHCKVGGGLMGNAAAHENEAPFPESLVERFILSFCPPKGIVLDPFMGSGTTAAVAKRLGRRFIGIDIRQSQVKLAKRRVYGRLHVEDK